MNSKVIAIPADKLGVLEHQFITATGRVTKRDRRQDFVRLNRVLKDLGLIERKCDVRSIAFGINFLGERNAFIICVVDQQIIGDVGVIIEDKTKGDFQ